MTVFSLHGICSIIMFFTSIFIIISILWEDKIKLLNLLDDKVIGIIASTFTIMFLLAFLLWGLSAISYSDRNKEYAGYSSEEICEKEIEKYNEKNNANIETYDDFIKFIELQWKFGNYVRNIGYLIIVLFYLIMVFIELNMNKLERKLEKIRKSIWELSDIPNPDDQTKQLLDLLSKTKKKLEKQIQLKSVSKSIKMLKQIQADESTVDITREIDELTALYQLNETDLLKEKYQ